MQPDIRWIEAVYGAPKPDGDNRTHIAVPETARAALKEMALDLVGTNGLVALYVPVGTEDVYSPGAKRGRIICAVQLLAMPPDKKVEDFFSMIGMDRVGGQLVGRPDWFTRLQLPNARS